MCEGTVLAGGTTIADEDDRYELLPTLLAGSDVDGTGLPMNETDGVGHMDGHAEVCGEFPVDDKGCWSIRADSSGCCNAN